MSINIHTMTPLEKDIIAAALIHYAYQRLRDDQKALEMYSHHANTIRNGELLLVTYTEKGGGQ